MFFPQFNIIINTSTGVTLLDVAQRAGIGIRSVCGGKGLCGKCKVLVKGRFEHRLVDKSIITEEEIAKGYALACIARVLDDIEVLIPPEAQFKKAKLLSQVVLPSYRVEPAIFMHTLYSYTDIIKITTFYRADEIFIKKAEAIIEKYNQAIAIINPTDKNIIDIVDNNSNIHGIAVDIGTTKIVVALIDLNTGKIIDIDSEFNKQIIYGEDIVSRISYAIERNGLKELQKAVIETINILIEQLCRNHAIDISKIYMATIAGNTAMTYLFLGISPYELIRSFRSPARVAPKAYILKAHELGLNINKEALVYVLPCAGRFLGGDVIGDIITAGANYSEDPVLLIDIGTNTEVVIGCKNWFIGTTAPAGPAFEGWGLKFGVRAIQGAIESINIDPNTLEPVYKTIGNITPIGICGSGYIDLIAQLFINGVIDRSGKFYRDINHPRVRKGVEGYEYVVAWSNESGIGRDIVITERDIYNIIDAKSSVCAAISILLKRMLLDIHKISKIYICGAFGRYINIDNAIAIGMIPEFPSAKITYIGNGSLGGAILTLVSKSYIFEAERVAKNMAMVELMLDQNFMDEYEAGFTLPGKPDLFPLWWKKSLEIKPWGYRS